MCPGSLIPQARGAPPLGLGVGPEHEPVCPGEVVEQEFLVANRGTRVAWYTRGWYLSDDHSPGNDETMLVEANRGKRSGAQYGVWWTEKSLSMPATFPNPSGENYILVEVVDSDQSRSFDERNDWTHFSSRYELAEDCD